MAAIFAISSALFYAISSIIAKLGLRHNDDLYSGVLISLISSLAISLALAMATTTLTLFISWAVLFFIAAGVVGPFVGRFLLYSGIDRVGASIAVPLYATKPLFSAIAAVLILSENLTFPIIAGIIFVIIGGTTISLEDSGGQIEKKWSKKDLIFPIISAICFGVSHVFRKMGLNILPNAMVGLTVQNAAALVFCTIYFVFHQKVKYISWGDKKSWFIFGLAGIASAIGQLCLFYALNLGQVIIISPLSAVSPLFVLLFAGLFLRKLERVTGKIIQGTVLIIVGAAILAVRSSS